MATILSHDEARRTYDRIGSFQDSQAFYEDIATSDLVRHADFPSAASVFEFGCGTGRFAQHLLADLLPPHARYRGIDLSPTMVGLARERLAPFADRAVVSLSEGGPPRDELPASVDRFVSNYVFDLLSDDDIRSVLAEAHRMLRPGGLLCLTSLSTGAGPLSRLVASAWGAIQALAPTVVGGCRPIDLVPFLEPSSWEIRHTVRFVAYGITSEVVIAEPLQAAGTAA